MIPAGSPVNKVIGLTKVHNKHNYIWEFLWAPPIDKNIIIMQSCTINKYYPISLKKHCVQFIRIHYQKRTIIICKHVFISA